MSTDTEAFRVAERAAEWLVRLEDATPAQLAEFYDWLTQSPLHVQEMLAAQACHVELARTLKNGRIAPGKLVLSGNSLDIDDPSHVRDSLIKLFRVLSPSQPPSPA